MTNKINLTDNGESNMVAAIATATQLHYEDYPKSIELAFNYAQRLDRLLSARGIQQEDLRVILGIIETSYADDVAPAIKIRWPESRVRIESAARGAMRVKSRQARLALVLERFFNAIETVLAIKKQEDVIERIRIRSKAALDNLVDVKRQNQADNDSPMRFHKSSQTRQKVLEIAKAFVTDNQSVQRKSLVAEVVQTGIVKKRQAEHHIDALVKSGELQKNWCGISYDPHNAIKEARREFSGRKNPVKAHR